MRNVGSHILDKMDEVVHYINSHQSGEPVHVDTNAMALHVDTGRVVTVMQGQGFSHMTRQVSVSDHVADGPWSQEILESDERLDALVAHLTQSAHQRSHHPAQKGSVRDETSVILDNNLRLFHAASLESASEQLSVQAPLPPLPPLQEMKRCPDTDWFHDKGKSGIKDDALLPQPLELSPAPHKQPSRKSLPHKKRISRKLKRNTGASTPQQGIVVINCASEAGQDCQEEILPDSFEPHTAHLPHHLPQEVRPVLICQLCGDFYGEEQEKFFHHLKQHYEPHNTTIIIENPVTDLNIDKMTNTCIVDNVATLPDSIVELSLENTVPKTMYQPAEKHILYSTSDKMLYSNKVQYSMSTLNVDKEGSGGLDKSLYSGLGRLEPYPCGKCPRAFRKQKQCEAHIKEAHSKIEDMGEFSEPEDLMEGIHVTDVEEAADYEGTLLPHLTVDNGTVRQDHVRHWYLRNGQCTGGAYCSVCARTDPDAAHTHTDTHDSHHEPHHETQENTHADTHETHTQTHDVHTQSDSHQTHGSVTPQYMVTKEEVLQRILETEQAFPPPAPAAKPAPAPPPPPPPPPPPLPPQEQDDKKKVRKFECSQCSRIFRHRNSLIYHQRAHNGRQQICRECGKSFYTASSLKIHKRVHSDDRPYRCEDCGREFRQCSDLKYHRISLHSNQKQYKCEFCGKDFARKYSLSVHRRIHTGERNYPCHYCNKTFRASSYRLSHMRTHTGVKPFKCTQCEKCFRVKGDLRRHTLVHEREIYRINADKIKVEKDQPAEEVKKEETGTNNKTKKIAVASTARPPVHKKPAKKKSNTKKGAPNVTMNKTEYKEYTNNVEVYDTRQEYTKFKDYTDSTEFHKQIPFKEKSYDEVYKGNPKLNEERGEFAVLKPMYRQPNMAADNDKQFEYRTGNTDGKMPVFQEKSKEYSGPIVTSSVSLADGRSDRDRDMHEGMESGFLERLTAFYNIPAV